MQTVTAVRDTILLLPSPSQYYIFQALPVREIKDDSWNPWYLWSGLTYLYSEVLILLHLEAGFLVVFAACSSTFTYFKIYSQSYNFAGETAF